MSDQELKHIVASLAISIKEVSASQKKTDKQIKELFASQKKTDEQIKELFASQKKTDAQQKKTDAQQKKTDEQIKELSASQKKTDEQIKELSVEHKKTEKLIKELSASQKKTDEQIKELFASQKKTDEQIKELSVEHKKTDAQQKKTDELIKELSASQKKTDEQIKELSVEHKKTDAQQKKTDELIKELSVEHKKTESTLKGLGFNVGMAVEEYFYNSLDLTKKVANIQFDDCQKNLHGFNRELKLQDEFDITMANTTKGLLVECKHHVVKEDVVKLRETSVHIPLQAQQTTESLTEPQLEQQQIKVSGIVKDEVKEPMIGATIKVKGSTTGVKTNVNGEFTLTVDPTAILVITFIGYESKEIAVNGQTELTVIMKVKPKTMEDVVVIGFATEDKKVSTASTSLITGEELTKTVSSRIEQAIQGKMAGVTINQNSGSPGSEFAVRIRGIGTPNSSDPLYVIDGVKAGGMDFLNPSDIERIDILKDAASAAIYGVAAANGVVLITTKKGQKESFEISYSGYGGIQQLEKKVNLLDAYQYNNLYGFGDPEYSTDWQSAVIGSAPITNHAISFSGGSKKITYNVSGGYYKQFGIVGAPIQPDKSSYERFTFRSNLQAETLDNLTIKANVSFSATSRRVLPENDIINGVVPRLLNYSPSVPIYDETTNNPYYDTRVASDLKNPVSTILTHETAWTQFKTFNDVTLEYEIIKGLKISVLQNIDYSEARNKIFQPEYNFAPQDNRVGNLLTEQRYTWYNWTNQGTISYNADFLEDHDFSILAGYSLFEGNYEFLTATNTALGTNNFNDANLGLATGGSAGAGTGAIKSSHSLLSFFGRINYVFQEKYALTSNLRVDGSSRFGPANRFAILPSVSASWVFSEEDFFNELNDVVNLAKLRVSWGLNGNEEIGDYGYYSNIYTGQRYVFGTGETETNGSTITVVTNPELRWETSSQLDVGLDFAFFNNKLTVSLDYYHKQTNDVLIYVPIPGQVGLGASAVNAGSVLNQGVELELVHKNSISDLKYTVTANVTYLNNNVLSLGNGGQPIWAGNLFHLGDNVSKTTVGSPIASFYGYKTQGVFQNQFEIKEYVGPDGKTLIQPNAVPGDFKYTDVNKDGKLDDNDKVYLGKPLPDVTASISIALEYMNFDFYVLFDGSFGNSVYRGYAGYNYGAVNQQANILNAWKKEGDASTHPITDKGYVSKESLKSSNFFVEDASFVKIRNVQLGYSLPKEIIAGSPVASLRVYASVQNLYTFTGYSGFDPEIGRIGNSLEMGIDKGFYPSARTFTFGIELKLR
ncbi:hypothetical protein CHS0354_000625 [Potamilus streckersoni]|uniref:TonB-dependent receptor n=1 Tax=Potamilus streckersoni TaxID=2493646 RepID=A0AAE0T7A8_9BIVA|nr:hypothetical protein CHS0354_000625 [Potamilus streckersoni]